MKGGFRLPCAVPRAIALARGGDDEGADEVEHLGGHVRKRQVGKHAEVLGERSCRREKSEGWWRGEGWWRERMSDETHARAYSPLMLLNMWSKTAMLSQMMLSLETITALGLPVVPDV